MNSESRNRLLEAAKYEKMAIRALFPERVAGHIEVIEQELKAMLMEFIMDIMKQEAQGAVAKEASERDNVKGNKAEKQSHTASKVKKVEIG